MHHLVRILGLAGALGAVAAPATLGAAPAVTIPVPVKPVACRELAPVLLTRGSAPRTPLRIDLRKVQSRSGRSVDLEQARTTTTFPGGTTHTVTQTRRIAAVLTARRLAANGRLPFSGRLHVTFPGAQPARKAIDTDIGGFFTAVNGGRVGPRRSGADATPVNDHLPLAPLGVGARWRVVNCEPIYDTPAKETRIYTLRSVGHGLLLISYRDDIELDPAHVDLGSENVHGVTVRVRLVALSGSSTGTERVVPANGFGERDRTVSRVSLTLRASATGRTPLDLRSTVVDTDTQVPAT